jgi:hypothetical protein
MLLESDMSYEITAVGGFRLTPPAGEKAAAEIAATGGGWRASPNGRLLYLTDDHGPWPFETLRHLVGSVLPAHGLVASGELRWRGEDGAEGLVRISGAEVTVEEPQDEPLSEAAVERLLTQLHTGNQAERLESAEAIEYFGLCVPKVLDSLAQALADPDRDVRVRVANTLAAFGESALPTLQALIRALDDPEPWVQAAAAEALGLIGSAAKPALPALERLTHHPSYGPSGKAREAIGRIAP